MSKQTASFWLLSLAYTYLLNFTKIFMTYTVIETLLKYHHLNETRHFSAKQKQLLLYMNQTNPSCSIHLSVYHIFFRLSVTFCLCLLKQVKHVFPWDTLCSLICANSAFNTISHVKLCFNLNIENNISLNVEWLQHHVCIYLCTSKKVYTNFPSEQFQHSLVSKFSNHYEFWPFKSFQNWHCPVTE